eukprot:913805-Prymnesium_polylepis.1
MAPIRIVDWYEALPVGSMLGPERQRAEASARARGGHTAAQKGSIRKRLAASAGSNWTVGGCAHLPGSEYERVTTTSSPCSTTSGVAKGLVKWKHLFGHFNGDVALAPPHAWRVPISAPCTSYMVALSRFWRHVCSTAKR